jgi:hypothetical protein
MFRMLKQIGSSFAPLPQEDFDEAMSRVMQLVKLAQNREVQPEQQVQLEQPDLDYVDLSDKTVL